MHHTWDVAQRTGTTSRPRYGTDVPDFRAGQGQPEHLATRFHAYVNGMNGNVSLERVRATANHTEIDASGDIDRKKGSRVTLSVANGRVQDLMQMFVHDGAPVTGGASLHADVFLPSEHRHFLKALQIKGNFAAACLNDDYDLVKRVKADFQAAEISDKLKALLVIAAKVQKGGKSVTSADVEAARALGATDRDS